MKLLAPFLIIISLIINLVLYPKLPAYLPVHWNFQGEIDNLMPKNQVLWFMPLLSLGLLILFKVSPKLDPKVEKYRYFKKEWQIIQTAIISFMIYIHLVGLYIALHPEVKLLPFMFMGLGTLFVLIGNYLSKIRQNYFLGIRTPWTLNNEENWNKTHRFASWTFVISGIITMAESFFLWFAPGVIFSSILLAALLPIVYSFLLYKKAVSRMKFVYLGIILIATVVIMFRLSSGEDNWYCNNGQWQAHGQPAAAMPTSPCR